MKKKSSFGFFDQFRLSTALLIVNTLYFIIYYHRVDKQCFLSWYKKYYILKNLVKDFGDLMEKDRVNVDEFLNYINEIYSARKNLRETPNNIPTLTINAVVLDKFIRMYIIEILEEVCKNNNIQEINEALEYALEEDRKLSILHKKRIPPPLRF
jgi:hypothetical protein